MLEPMPAQPQRFSRRSFLALGGLAVAGASGFAPRGTAVAGFQQPDVLRSQGGRLHVRLVAAQGAWLNGEWTHALGYTARRRDPRSWSRRATS
jgi:hypothetical protein